MIRFGPKTIRFHASIRKCARFRQRAICCFPTVARVRVRVLRVVRICLIRIGGAIKSNFRIIRRVATMGPIAIAGLRVRYYALAKPVVGVKPRPPMGLFFLGVVACPKGSTRRTVANGGAIMLRLLPVQGSVLTTVTRGGEVS